MPEFTEAEMAIGVPCRWVEIVDGCEAYAEGEIVSLHGGGVTVKGGDGVEIFMPISHIECAQVPVCGTCGRAYPYHGRRLGCCPECCD